MEQKTNINNPWLSIWVRPRQTIQKIIEMNPNHRLWILCWIYGFPWLLSVAQSLSLGRFYSATAIVLVSLLFAIPIGYIIMSISSFFFLWIGKLIRGTGSFVTIRSAIAWANIPNFVAAIVWLILIAFFQEGTFHGEFARESGYSGYFLIAFGVQLVFGIWAFIIFLHALGQVQKFSAWMALLNTVLVSIVYIALIFGFSYLLSLWGGQS